MKAADICVLDFALERLEGERKASIESGMHAAVYQERPDVNAIVHTHQPYASALALVRQPIPALFDEQVRFLGRSVEIIDYAPSGTGFLKKNVRKRITSGDNAFILANHGVLVLGGDVDRAVFNMALLEKVALDYLLALMTGEKAVHKVPAPIREIAFAKLRGDERKLKTAGSRRRRRRSRRRRPPRRRRCRRGVGRQRRRAAPTAAAAGASRPARQLAGYAISAYPDVAAVYARLERLVSRPLRPIRPAGMDEYLDYFETKCRRSQGAHRRSR